MISHLGLREKFALFWQQKGHVEVPPIPLVPENDPTTLFTGSGMQQLVPYLMGEPHPLDSRLYNIQRSFRGQDIEEVGDNRHDTFFEMLGNWSLGDYFKKEQISWFYEFLTKVLNLDKNKLYVTIFSGFKKIPKDEESENIWKSLGISESRIVYYGADKNWWSRAGTPEEMPEGEIGGPDSEVFYDLGTKHDPQFGKNCHPNCDCGRFIELGNSVFIQYKKVNGELIELPKKNVDFGGGLERMLVALQNKKEIFETDVFYPIISEIEKLSSKKYHTNATFDQAFRILSDHLRASVFLIADGVLPSNIEQGYVLRRLIRRAVRFCRTLELSEQTLAKLSNVVIEIFKIPYPYLLTKKTLITQILEDEEIKFRKTLNRGIKELEKIITQKNRLTAKDVFFLFESHGIPIETTLELAKEKGVNVDTSELETEKKWHQEVSKKGMEKKFKGGLSDTSEQSIKYHTATHLLHQALREVLGKHVQQKGSNITAERLRFDFSHDKKLGNEEIKKLEDKVNQKIQENLSVSFEVMDYKEALNQGALAFFGQRYPEKVKVYSIGPSASSGNAPFSQEVCGGPHVEKTGVLGKFKITKAESLGANLQRLYAILE